MILDVHGLAIDDPAALESEINQWPGVVCVGIFARRRATVCLLGTAAGRAHPDVLTPEARSWRVEKRVTSRLCTFRASSQEGWPMAKPNYSFEKRQRELAKKKKKEQKEKEKAGRKLGTAGDGEGRSTGGAGARSGAGRSGDGADGRLNESRGGGAARDVSSRRNCRDSGSAPDRPHRAGRPRPARRAG